jgi:GTP-sensing pleiotropic transcriptional regulator CodY
MNSNTRYIIASPKKGVMQAVIHGMIVFSASKALPSAYASSFKNLDEAEEFVETLKRSLKAFEDSSEEDFGSDQIQIIPIKVNHDSSMISVVDIIKTQPEVKTHDMIAYLESPSSSIH